MENDTFIGKVIYLVCWPITQREVNVWGIDYLRTHGFDVEVYDLTLLLRKYAIIKAPVETKIVDDYIHVITSYKELADKLKQADEKTMFLDYIVSISDISFQTTKLFRMLRKSNIRYCSVYSGALPGGRKANCTRTKVKKLIKRIRNAFNLHELINYIARRINRYLINNTNIYPLPEILFTTIESDDISYYIEKYPRMRNRLVPINAYDYDNYLKYINTSQREQLTEKTCVFLDIAATHHSDTVILGLKKLGKEAYYNSMNRLFDNIELKTGLKVIIAAHPKSRYEEMPGVFGGREIIKGKTMELVSQSSMVVMHHSTSVSYAVLFKKPIMVVKTQEMVDADWYGEGIDIMAQSLGLRAVNIDNDEILDSLDFNYSEWNITKYDDYMKKYLMSETSAGLTTWEIVAREFKDMILNKIY